MIRSTAAPITRSSGKREVFRFRGAGSWKREACGLAGACPKVSDAGLENIRVYSPGPFGTLCGGTFGAVIGGGLAGRGVAKTWVALPTAGGGGAAGVGGGGGEGMSPRPKTWVNSPASLAGEGGRGGAKGAMCCGDGCEDGAIGDSKNFVNSLASGGWFIGGAGTDWRCACSIWVNSPASAAGGAAGAALTGAAGGSGLAVNSRVNSPACCGAGGGAGGFGTGGANWRVNSPGWLAGGAGVGAAAGGGAGRKTGGGANWRVNSPG
jgi:hypothetical protein